MAKTQTPPGEWPRQDNHCRPSVHGGTSVTGLVWLSNGLAKVIEKSSDDIGFFSLNLVDKSTARSILTGAAAEFGNRWP